MKPPSNFQQDLVKVYLVSPMPICSRDPPISNPERHTSYACMCNRNIDQAEVVKQELHVLQRKERERERERTVWDDGKCNAESLLSLKMGETMQEFNPSLASASQSSTNSKNRQSGHRCCMT